MLLTFLKHGGNALLCLGVVLLAGLWAGGLVALGPGWIALGALLFYLSEYSWHRFVFHAEPASSGWLRRLQHRLHYDHHAEPERLDLLFLPVWFIAPNLAATGALIALVLGVERLPAVLLGVCLAILHYEWTHYVAHIPYQPRTPFGRWMKRYHLRHHFISEKFWFGVSNPALDALYGTFKSVKDVEKSRTVRTLNG